MEEQRKPSVPLERQEIKGLTLEAIVKYGTIIVLLMYSFFTLKSNNKDNRDYIDRVNEKFGEKIMIMEKDIDALKESKQATEIWKTRFEGKFK